MGMVKLRNIPSLESVLYLGYKLYFKLFFRHLYNSSNLTRANKYKKIHEMDFYSFFLKDFLVQPNCFEWEFIYAMSQNGNADALNGNFCITVNFNQKNVE